jgi:calcineurin-like phosphoesterase family protein
MSGEFFVTSDTFFSRPSIIDIAKRPFSSVEEMNAIMVENWNKAVKPNDVIYHLGNLVWNPVAGEEILKQLNGKIYLIQGDYDDAAVNIAKHFINKLYILPDSILNETTFNCVLSHWPLAEWAGKDKGLFHIHGHTLNKMKTDLNEMNRINICTDNWNFTPQPIEETLSMLKNFEKKSENTLGSE